VRPRGAPEHERRPIGCALRPRASRLGEDEAAGALERAAHVLRTVHALTPGAP
jgi:hypothetical protein